MTGFLLHLFGPMQSWADTGFGQLREAGEAPTRAAVIGLIGAALGVPRYDSRLVDLHDALRVHVATVRHGTVRRDFHTVETRRGSPPTLTARDYHHDAHFVALVTGSGTPRDPEVLAEAADALRRPVYVTFLGRRSCPPALPLLPVEVDGDPYEALLAETRSTERSFPRGDATWRRGRCAADVTVWLDGHITDVPAAFAGARTPTYGARRARLIGPHRAYAASPVTRLRLPREVATGASPDADAHQTYFDAAP